LAKEELVSVFSDIKVDQFPLHPLRSMWC